MNSRLICFQAIGALAITAVFATTPATAKPWRTIPADIRNTDAPLPTVVHMAQAELRIDTDPGGYDEYNSDGLLGALIDGAIQSSRAKKSRAEMEPVLAGLGAFDADSILMDGVRKAVSDVDWLSLSSPRLSRDASLVAKSALLDEARGNYLLDVSCGYNISRKFNAVYAACWLQIAVKDGGGKSRGEDRWKPEQLVYANLVEAEVAIANPASELDARRAQWLGNSGEPLRRALRLALEKLGPLVGHQLTLTDAEIAAAKSRTAAKISTAYVGVIALHAGNIVEGEEGIADFMSPNPAGKLARYKLGADGMLLLQKGGNYYYHYSFNIP